jgi:hypothetical protein
MACVKQGGGMLQPWKTSQKEHNRQAMIWDKHAKQIKPYQQYNKVAAITISWGDTDMDVSEEVRMLANT